MSRPHWKHDLSLKTRNLIVIHWKHDLSLKTRNLIVIHWKHDLSLKTRNLIVPHWKHDLSLKTGNLITYFLAQAQHGIENSQIYYLFTTELFFCVGRNLGMRHSSPVTSVMETEVAYRYECCCIWMFSPWSHPCICTSPTYLRIQSFTRPPRLTQHHLTSRLSPSWTDI